ncbi:MULTISPECIES: 2-phosphosulfolactate phosphatase [unclassified Kribbella]|uniref:2-phosphosulfolactate phosphatase n=1 Tax=unclassified Kribbella TaxID=2644121 RepID=UPI003016F02F
MTSPYAQDGFRVGFDWATTGAAAVPGSITAVVDVLSFTTAVTVAADLGIEVYPYRWRDESAVAYAKQYDAALAVGRSEAGPGQVSLSPVTVRQARGIKRLVLPSPNGSTISQQLSDAGTTVIAVSLRNRAAAAEWVSKRLAEDPQLTVVAIAAGERWKDGSLRPAVEDLWGAGGFLAALDVDGFSPEARAAAAAYKDAEQDLQTLLHDCAGGRELTQYGFAQDVAIAAELDSSRSVPVLRDGKLIAST